VTTEEIVCREFAELTTDYLEGALPRQTLELVEEHLVMCGWCRDHLDHVTATTAAIAQAPPPAPPEEALSSLLQAFRDRTGGAES
jgi:predicted anti-sigma-YlaC factor YlaD